MIYYSTCFVALLTVTPHPITTTTLCDPYRMPSTQNIILQQHYIHTCLSTDGIMERRIRCEDHKFSLHNYLAWGVCRLLEGSNVDRLYHLFEIQNYRCRGWKTRWCSWLRHCATRRRSRVRMLMVSLRIFLIVKFLAATLRPCGNVILKEISVAGIFGGWYKDSAQGWQHYHLYVLTV